MKNIHVKDNGRTLIYQPLAKPTKQGAVATLVGYIKDGKKFTYALLFCFLLSALCFGLGGCGTTPNTPTGSVGVNSGPNGANPTVNAGIGWDATSNINVSATGAVDQTGNWNAGFTVTFKDAVPADVTARLAEAGGVRARDTALNEWKFPHVKSPSDPALMQAVAAAAGSGVAFTVTPLR